MTKHRSSTLLFLAVAGTAFAQTPSELGAGPTPALHSLEAAPLTPSAPAAHVRVTLKDGQTLNGVLLGESPDQVMLDLGGSQVSVPRATIRGVDRVQMASAAGE